MMREIQRWEDEGGALPDVGRTAAASLHGSRSQVEWAERIRRTVNAEFDRVAKALASATSKQSLENQDDAREIIAILEDKRSEVMAIDEAGYFIHEWHGMEGRVRQMIVKDPRYAAIRAKRVERRSP